MWVVLGLLGFIWTAIYDTLQEVDQPRPPDRPPSTTAHGLRLRSLPLGSGQVFKRSRVMAQRCSISEMILSTSG